MRKALEDQRISWKNSFVEKKFQKILRQFAYWKKPLNISKLFAADVIKNRSQTLLWDWYNEEFDIYNLKAVNDKLMQKLMNGSTGMARWLAVAGHST